MSRLSKALIVGLLIGMLGMAATLVPCGLDLEENIGLDLLFKLRGVREAPSEVVVVTVDKVSADKLNLPIRPDKWPRSLHARLIENLVRKGAAVIAFDMTFDQPRSPEHDNLFAEAIKNAGNVVLCEYLKKEKISLTDARGAHTGDHEAFLHQASVGLLLPILDQPGGTRRGTICGLNCWKLAPELFREKS